MSFELILLLLCTILPVFYTANLGLFLYEWKKYLTTFWKNKLINFWFPIIGLLFILSFWLFFDKNLEMIFFPICFYFLIIYNIYVLWKVFRGKLEHTLNKKYAFMFLIFVWIDIFWILFFLGSTYLYTYLFFILLINYIILIPMRLYKNSWKIV